MTRSSVHYIPHLFNLQVKSLFFLVIIRLMIKETDLHMRLKNTKQYLIPGAAQKMSARSTARVLRLM